MTNEIAEANIHIRVRTRDRDIVDRAAELTGANRSQFIMGAALKEAMNVLFDNARIAVDSETFNAISDWLDNPKSAAEKAGMKRLKAAKAPWS